MPKKEGRPAYEPTDEMREKVQQLSAMGTRYEDIALYIGVSKPTLTKYYQKELELGRIKANATIAGKLFDRAKDGDITACIFWLKTRAGWRETQRTEITGEDGKSLNMKIETNLADLVMESYANRKKEDK